MFNRRFNCCVFNHPCPICCSALRCCSQNEVINPVVPFTDYGFFNNLSVGAVVSNAIIPLNFVQGFGDEIVSNLAGGITLTPGTYEVSYFANGIVPADGVISIKLRQNGVDLSGSDINQNQSAGDVVTINQTIAITVPDTGTLQLVNDSGLTTTYSTASLLIKKI